jgi:hypothetical protein
VYDAAVDRHLRRSETLEISEALARQLASLRGASTQPAELDVDRVRDVEATVGARIPDPVLAALAADIGWLREVLGCELGRLADHTARAREARAPGDLVGIAVSSDGRRIYGFRPGRGDDRIDVFNADTRSTTTTSLSAWLDEMRHAHGPAPTEASAQPLVARLVRSLAPEGPGRRVLHKVWGIGRVLAEHGEGPTRKVKADFPKLGLKVVQARFLEFVDDD